MPSAPMLAIPEDFVSDVARPSHRHDGVTVVDYVAHEATVGLHVVVTQPTLVFVHEGVKDLSSGPSSPTVAATSGDVVAMRTGAHVMSDLLPNRSRYRSTIISVERKRLRSLLGQVPDEQIEQASSTTSVDEGLRSLADHFSQRLVGARDDLERTLAVKELLVATMLHEDLRQTLAADLVGWGPSAQDRIGAVVGRHVYQPLTLPQYAAMCAMSLSTFKRRFTEAYGIAPGRWLIDARLSYAAGLLTSGNQPVTDICTASGFGDLSNFIRSFNERFEMSPTAYRRTAGRAT